VYATAAALTLTVLSGYLTTRQTPADSDTARVAANLAPQPQSPAVTPTEPRFVDSVSEVVRGPGAQPGAPLAMAMPLAVDSPRSEPPSSANLEVLEEVPAPARFDLGAPAAEPSVPQQVAWMNPPAVPSAAPANESLVATWMLPDLPQRFALRRGADAPPDRGVSSTPAATAKTIDGYWIMTRSRVWDEDLRPVWRPEGLLIEGSVEDESARQRVQAAITRGSAEPVAFEIRLREAQTRAGGDSGVRFVKASFDGAAAGGTVRRSLLGHFEDAARRSFVSPQPAALEGEIVRFVSDVFRNQSEFLNHVYALQRLLSRIEPAQLESVSGSTAQRFREVARFHLRALDEREAAIYDRLSEALPRKYWTYRGETGGSVESDGWQEESEALLRDSLQLDSRLTALFGSTTTPVTLDELDLSCGELLQRIRTHIRRLKSQTRAL
jgi:hypothetical protein